MDKGSPPRDTQHNRWAGLKDWGFTSEANRLNHLINREITAGFTFLIFLFFSFH